MGWVDACAPSFGQPWLDSTALAAWYASRGAAPPIAEIEPDCREVKLGPRAEAALLCERIQHESRGAPGTPLHTYRVLTLVSIRTARKKRAVTLLELPIQVDLLDKETDDDAGPLFALDLAGLSGPGAALPDEIILREPKEGACAEAERKVKSARDEARALNNPTGVAWARIDEELRARLCRAVGTYRYQNDRFATTTAPPAPPKR